MVLGKYPSPAMSFSHVMLVSAHRNF